MAAQGAVLPPLPAGPGFPMPQAYVFLNGGQLVTDVNITVKDAIRQVLHWIVFRTEDARIVYERIAGVFCAESNPM